MPDQDAYTYSDTTKLGPLHHDMGCGLSADFMVDCRLLYKLVQKLQFFHTGMTSFHIFITAGRHDPETFHLFIALLPGANSIKTISRRGIMTKDIGFIGGGQMGEALVKGLLKAGLCPAEALLVAEPHAQRRSDLETSYGIETTNSSAAVWQSCRTVVLAVKPQAMADVLATASPRDSQLIITIAAGLPIAAYEDLLNRKDLRIIRVMPNTPALVLEAASALCCNTNVTTDDLQRATDIFNAVGTAVVLDERYLDAVTGLSGSGPAYVFTFIEALIDAGVKTGLARDVAETLAVQTVLGSVKLMQAGREHPAVLRSRVTSPGGTTIAGLHILEKNAFRGTIMDAVEAATNRSMELGRK